MAYDTVRVIVCTPARVNLVFQYWVQLRPVYSQALSMFSQFIIGGED